MTVGRMLEWVIVGGGLQGSHLALVLRARLGVAESDIRVVDDAPAPFARWRARATACAMTWLRSPQVHHLGLRSDSLRSMAPRLGFDHAFTAPYQRPATALFDAHCTALMTAWGLDRLREQDRVVHIEACGDGYRVHGRCGVWRTRRVLLAPGPAAPRRPAWGPDLPHVFDLGFKRQALLGATLAVIGGGLSAAQLALAAASEGWQVRVIAPYAPRVADFDSQPCYAGPRCLRPFLAEDWRGRRRRITQARNPGTLPRDVAATLAQTLRQGRITWHQGRAEWVDDAGVRLGRGRRVGADAVVLATGFADRRPGGALVEELLARWSLPLAPCGYPVLDRRLQWRPGLFVAGRLAELELGPMAGNIRGARLAGERLAAAV